MDEKVEVPQNAQRVTAGILQVDVTEIYNQGAGHAATAEMIQNAILEEIGRRVLRIEELLAL